MTTPRLRSNAVSATYTVIALVFFFGVGLAGGTAYKLLATNDDSDQKLADQAAPPALSQPAPAQPNPSLAADAAAPSLAHLTPTAPPALTMPPAPLPPVATVVAAPPTPAPQAAPAPDQQAAPAPPPTPHAAATPQSPAAPPAAVAQRHAVPAKKPHIVAKTTRAVPAPTIALHAPPAAPGNVAGPFRVQFGAFANEDNARRMQWAVEATGMKVEVTRAPGASGQPLYYLRSPIYADYAAALSAAQTVQDRVQHFVNAIPVDYAILGDHSAIEQQAQAQR